MSAEEVLPGIHRIAHAATCCYLLQRGDTLVLVDACLPRTRPRMRPRCGRSEPGGAKSTRWC